MGVKCYLLLSWVPEWRWGLTGKKTGWYNSTTLIRQERRGDWTGVMKQARLQINEIIKK